VQVQAHMHLMAGQLQGQQLNPHHRLLFDERWSRRLQPWPTHGPGWSRRGSGCNGSSEHPLTLSNSLSQGGVLADTKLPRLPVTHWALPFYATHIKKFPLPV